jgi:hypothetical protein
MKKSIKITSILLSILILISVFTVAPFASESKTTNVCVSLSKNLAKSKCYAVVGDNWRPVTKKGEYYEVEMTEGESVQFVCMPEDNTSQNIDDATAVSKLTTFNDSNQYCDLSLVGAAKKLLRVVWSSVSSIFSKSTGSNSTGTSNESVDYSNYCLIGYIDGADVGCEKDYQTVTNLFASNGTQTLTFAQESYVFVKTTDNANWYMFEEYCKETTGTLKLSVLGDKNAPSEKMLVPAGTYTFTLEDNGNDTFKLSYVSAVAQTTETTTVTTEAISTSTTATEASTTTASTTTEASTTESTETTTEVVTDSTETVVTDPTESSTATESVVTDPTENSSSTEAPNNTEATTNSTDSTNPIDPTESTSESTSAVTDPTESTSESTTVVTDSTESTSEATPVVTAPTESTSESTSGATDPTESTSESTSVVTDPTESTSESTTVVTDPTESTSEATPVVTAPTESTSESTSAVTDPTESTSESTSVATDPTESTVATETATVTDPTESAVVTEPVTVTDPTENTVATETVTIIDSTEVTAPTESVTTEPVSTEPSESVTTESVTVTEPSESTEVTPPTEATTVTVPSKATEPPIKSVPTKIKKVKAQGKRTINSGDYQYISYNENGIISDWYTYTVQGNKSNKKVKWEVANSKYENIVKINDKTEGKVTFKLDSKKAVHKETYTVNCKVGKKIKFSINLYFFKFEKLRNVKINRAKSNTVNVEWGKTTNSKGFFVTIKDLKTKKVVTKTIKASKKKKTYSYTYKKLKSKHKYKVSVKLIFKYKKTEYYGQTSSKKI